MRRLLFVVLAFVPGALSSACSSGDNGASDASTDYFGVLPGPDAGSGSDGDDGGGGLSTTMRLAHLSPDVGPLDFCWRVSGSATFTGPVLHPAVDAGASDAGALEAGVDATLDGSKDATIDAGASDAATTADAKDEGAPDGDASSEAAPGDAQAGEAGPGDGGTAALEFGELTQDVALKAAGTFDIALVAAGALSCARPVLVGQVTLDAGKRSTVAVMGTAASDAGASALAVVAYTDDPMPDPQNARVRFIHAALGWPGAVVPAPSLSVTASGPPPAPLAADVEARHASAMSPANPMVDGLGYATVPPLAPTQLRLRATGDASAATWQTTDPVTLAAGSVQTGFIVSAQGGALTVFWCGESKTAGSPASCGRLAAH